MFRRLTFLFLLIAGLATCMENEGNSKPAPPQSILFIGNSFTSENGGLEVLLGELTSSINPDFELFTAAITHDGATLKELWNDMDIRNVVQLGAFELVVVQGDIPEGGVSSFNDYATKFVTEAKNAGTRPILLMGWAYDRLSWISQEEIARAHDVVSAVSGVEIAPVGLAWSRAMRERSGLQLYAADMEHPSLSGSYLTACVVYATVVGESPEGAVLKLDKGAIDRDEARFLQRIAWDTVQSYQGK